MICRHCGKEFEGRKDKQFCKESCKVLAYKARKKEDNELIISNLAYLVRKLKNKEIENNSIYERLIARKIL